MRTAKIGPDLRLVSYMLTVAKKRPLYVKQ